MICFVLIIVSLSLPMWSLETGPNEYEYITGNTFIFGGEKLNRLLEMDIWSKYDMVYQLYGSPIFMLAYAFPIIGLILSKILNSGKKRYYAVSFILIILSGMLISFIDRIYCFFDYIRVIGQTKFFLLWRAAYTVGFWISIVGIAVNIKNKKKDKSEVLDTLSSLNSYDDTEKRICPSCGTENKDKNKFCYKCGKDLIDN